MAADSSMLGPDCWTSPRKAYTDMTPFLRSALAGPYCSGALDDPCHPLVSRFMGELGQRALLHGGIGNRSGVAGRGGRNRGSRNDGRQPSDAQEAGDER